MGVAFNWNGLLGGIGVSGLLLGGLLGGGEWALRQRPISVTVADREYPIGPGPSAIDSALARLSEGYARRTITVTAGPTVLEVPPSELGLAVDEGALRRLVSRAVTQEADRPSSLGARLTELYRYLSPEPGGLRKTSVPLPLTWSEETARAFLTHLAETVDVEPEDAEMRITEHRILPSKAGQRVSIEESLLRLARSGLEPAIELAMLTLRPQVTEEDLLPVDISQVLATFETSYRGKAGSRAVNIRTAARYLNGAVILPGEVLSFNSRVGNRLHARGFVDAPVIVNDELEEDVGGGVCQVATTLHGAAVFGDLEIVERRSHSRPSGYAPLGLDATVIDGKVDLRVRNPSDRALLVHAWIPKPYLLRVEILGRKPDVVVEHSGSVTERESFARRVWHREELDPNAVELKQKGSQGMDVLSVVVRRREGKEIGRRSYWSKYYPVPEVYYVGAGVSPRTLPPPAPEVRGLLIDGDEAMPPSAPSPSG